MISIPEQIVYPDLPNWSQFSNLITKSKNDILEVAHETVRVRLAFANFHLSILRQAKENNLKRAMFENTIINLVSSLEAIAHVLNQVYKLDVPYHKVELKHQMRNGNHTRYCMRCKLLGVNESLEKLLLNFLLTGSPTDNWYEALVQYRNQIVHRPHFIAKSIIEGYYLPDDPTIITPTSRSYFDTKKRRTVWANYTKRRDIKKFTEFSFLRTLEIVESIYGLLTTDLEMRHIEHVEK